MLYSEEYFEDEVRCGFYIPSMVKRAWAVGLDVLGEVDRICRKYNIEYWVDWGTLIGAVRHGGFIPWDDDIDISMKRKDYKRFMEVAIDEIGDRFCLYTYRENKDYWGFVTRMTVKNRICFEPEHLERCHQFPYIAGLDIFIWDYVYRNPDKEEERCKAARTLIEFADEACTGNHDEAWVKNGLGIIKQIAGINVQPELFNKDKTAFRTYLYERAEEYFAVVDESESDIMTRMMPNGLYSNTSLRIPKQYFDDTIYIPFENIKVPVPLDYDEMLKIRYGDYMRLVKNQSGHDYPFFMSQKNSLLNILQKENVSFKKEYQYSKQEILKDRSNSYKATINACLGEMEQIIANIADNPEELLVTLQQYTIDLGGFIESIKGEGTDSVKELEKLCESIFNAYENNIDLSCVLDTFKSVKEVILNQIINRQLTVFLVTKAAKWKYFAGAYEERKKNGDVVVIPIPYHHKRFDGSYIDEIYEYEEFFDICPVVKYDEFDLSLYFPEEIFIETAFDEFNDSITVNPFFYSANVKKYTESLKYIPDFILDDFTMDSEREYNNMMYYCTVPGVVNADEVYVNSEQTRNMYIKKLTEFAGIDTEKNWDAKIIVKPWKDKKDALMMDNSQLRAFLEHNNNKKILLYFCGISELIHNGRGYIIKVKNNLEVFKENKDKIAVIFTIQDGIFGVINEKTPELLPDIEEIVEIIRNTPWMHIIESKDINLAEKVADAYYGDVNSVVQNFRNDKKPVMIQKVL